MRAWDFSSAEGVLERQDAARAARDAQRSLRRQRGSKQHFMKAPRFSPSYDSDAGSDAQAEQHAEDGNAGSREACSSASAAELYALEGGEAGLEPRGWGSMRRCKSQVEAQEIQKLSRSLPGGLATGRASTGRVPPPLPACPAGQLGKQGDNMTSWDILRPQRSAVGLEEERGRACAAEGGIPVHA